MGKLTSGYRFCQFFVKDFFEKMSTLSFLHDAIRSGDVYCHCDIDRMDAEPRHGVGCLWQRYMEEIYRIGRAADEAAGPDEILRRLGAMYSITNWKREQAHYEGQKKIEQSAGVGTKDNPDGAHPPALTIAERKGREAALAGKTEDHCPYVDRRTANGSVTWSRSFIRAWHKGFKQEQKNG